MPSGVVQSSDDGGLSRSSLAASFSQSAKVFFGKSAITDNVIRHGTENSPLIVGQYDVSHQGIDLAGPAAAAEHAVVADTSLHVVFLAVGPEARAEVVRRHGLADRADIVALALDREQGGAADRLGVDPAVLPVELPLGQQMLLEHALHGLEIELRRHVEHGEILVVEILDR